MNQSAENKQAAIQAACLKPGFRDAASGLRLLACAIITPVDDHAPLARIGVASCLTCKACRNDLQRRMIGGCLVTGKPI